MKIGTITVQNGNNYGASLQAFALIQYLREKGMDAYLIDYRNEKIERRLAEQTEITSWETIGHIKKNIRIILSNVLWGTKKYIEEKNNTFDNFHKKIMNSSEGAFYENSELLKLNDVYDAFICGSDQIWNKDITGLDDAFFLKFANSGKKRIAYAPSLGKKSNDIDKMDYRLYYEKLKNLDSLSVREENNKDFIESITHRKCNVVLDPVLLLNKNKWLDEIKDVPEIVSGKYAVFYPVINQPELEKFAMQKAKEKGIKLINPRLVPRYARVKGYTAFSNVPVGPLEFVKLLCEAECIFTNSFHATVFSSIFNKELFVIKLKGKNQNRNNRILEYMKMLGIEENSINESNLIHISSFESIVKWEKFEQQKNISNEYLKEALNGVLEK